MLRHIRQSQVYWYCSNCKQEMPNLADWMKITAILDNFRSHSCQMPMNFSDQFSNFDCQEGTLENILGKS